jgi:hypothetical protein
MEGGIARMSSNTLKASTSTYFARRRNHPHLIRCLPERLYWESSTNAGSHAASRVLAIGLCDLEGISSTTAGTRLDAQSMQRRCSTGAAEAASRVFNVE